MIRLLTIILTNFFFHVKCCVLTMTMMNFKHENEFSIAFNELNFDFIFIWMMFKKICFKRVNTLSFSKFENNQIDRNFLKDLIVVIQISTFHIIIFDFEICFLFFIVIEQNTTWHVRFKTNCVNQRNWFKKCSKQIINNFVFLQ